MKLTVVSIVMLAVLLSTAAAADGPIDKGSMIESGTAFLQYQSGELYENWKGEGLLTIAIAESFGYFVSPGFMLGGEFVVTSLSQGGNSLTTLNLGPVLGYYFNTDPTRSRVKGSVYPYVKGFFFFGTISNGSSLTQTTFGVQGGVVFMMSKAVGTDLGLRFHSDRLSNGGSAVGTTVWFGAGITAFIW